MQFKFPGQIEISVENARTCEESVIVKNILKTFVQWKNKIVNVKGTCLNHVCGQIKVLQTQAPNSGMKILFIAVSYILQICASK